MPSCARICPTLAATVDVLHALIERVGNQGVHTYAELRSYLPNTVSTGPHPRQCSP